MKDYEDNLHDWKIAKKIMIAVCLVTSLTISLFLLYQTEKHNQRKVIDSYLKENTLLLEKIIELEEDNRLLQIELDESQK